MSQVRAGEELKAACNEACQAMVNFRNKYNATLGALQIKYAVLPESVKEFKDKYYEKHTESVELITEYYLVASEYVEYILNPTGTLSELSQTIAYYTKQLDQIEKKIQLS